MLEGWGATPESVESINLPSIILLGVLPFRMELSHIFLRHLVVILLRDILARVVMIHTVLTVTLDHVLTE